MEATRRSSPRRSERRPLPGVGIASCLLAIAILGTLGSAVIKKRQAVAQSNEARDAADTPDHAWPAKPVLSTTEHEQSAEPSEATDALSQRGTLQPWPPAIALRPPTYETPYPIVASQPSGGYQLPPLDELLDGTLVDGPAYDEPTAIDDDSAEPSFAEVSQDTTPSDTLSADDASDVARDESDELNLQAMPVLEIAGDANLPVATSLSDDEGFTLKSQPGIEDTASPADADATPKASSSAKSLFAAPRASESPVATESTFALEPESTIENTERDLEAAEQFLTLNDTEALRAGATPIEELLLDTPAPQQVAKLLTSDVQDAFTLGRHGALFSARSRFISVLRKIAISKDAADTTDRHSLALAAGLCALDEAESFLPRGDAMETDLNVTAIAASHKTPLYQNADGEADASTVGKQWVLPHEAIARYHRYAQHKLAIAVAGDQAGSMALYGLGKTYARLEVLDEAPLAGRTSLTMYRAAVEAHASNYLAANELGVGLARVGRYQAAQQALSRAVASGGTSTVYRNLASVQRNLGQHQLASAAEARAAQLAAGERVVGAFSRERGVKWVKPEEFSRVADSYSRQGVSRPPQTAAAGQPPQQPLATRPQPGPRTAQRPSASQPSSAPSLASRMMPWRRSSPPGLQAPATPESLRAIAPTNPTARPVRSQTIVR
ncbi:MAG: hypothetical protein AAGF31_07775 [Planctomycetota bacterium]